MDKNKTAQTVLNPIIIEVSGGVADCTYNPTKHEVIIVDHDNGDTMPDIAPTQAVAPVKEPKTKPTFTGDVGISYRAWIAEDGHAFLFGACYTSDESQGGARVRTKHQHQSWKKWLLEKMAVGINRAIAKAQGLI